jgi:hypothetical protein
VEDANTILLYVRGVNEHHGFWYALGQPLEPVPPPHPAMDPEGWLCISHSMRHTFPTSKWLVKCSKQAGLSHNGPHPPLDQPWTQHNSYRLDIHFTDAQ